MKQVSEYFKEKPEKTLDELEKELTPQEIQNIIYSQRVMIIKGFDEKLFFTYFDVSKKTEQEVAKVRKRMGLTEDGVIVSKAVERTEKGPIYQVMGLEEVPELSKYLRSSQGKSHAKRSS